MKLKHINKALESNFYANKLNQIKEVDCKENDHFCLTTRIGNKRYNTTRREHLVSVLSYKIKEQVKLVNGFEIQYESEVLGEKINITVNSNYRNYLDWHRVKTLKWEACIGYYNPDRKYDLILNRLKYLSCLNIPLDLEDSEKTIIQKVENKLKEYFFYHDSVFGAIQVRHNLASKQDVIRWYKIYLERQKAEMEVKYNHDEVRRFLEKKFNVEIWVTDLVKVGNVLAKDGIKYKETKRIEKYDHSWIFDFDGDVDEIEQEFNSSFEDNVLYVF